MSELKKHFWNKRKTETLLVVNIQVPELVQVDKLAETERGTGGFGSTGR